MYIHERRQFQTWITFLTLVKMDIRSPGNFFQKLTSISVFCVLRGKLRHTLSYPSVESLKNNAKLSTFTYNRPTTRDMPLTYHPPKKVLGVFTPVGTCGRALLTYFVWNTFATFALVKMDITHITISLQLTHIFIRARIQILFFF